MVVGLTTNAADEPSGLAGADCALSAGGAANAVPHASAATQIISRSMANGLRLLGRFDLNAVRLATADGDVFEAHGCGTLRCNTTSDSLIQIPEVLRKSGDEAAPAVDRGRLADGAEHDLFMAFQKLTPAEAQNTETLIAGARQRNILRAALDRLSAEWW